MDFNIILACDSMHGIGRSGFKDTIPWKIKDDMAFFKDTTCRRKENTINVLIMGRKTADTLSKPLPDRMCIVITNQDYRRDGFVTHSSLDSALDDLSKNEKINDVFVIGGAVFADFAIKHKRCRTVYLVTIAHNYNCDIRLSSEFIGQLDSNIYIRSSDSMISYCKSINQHVELTINKYTYVNQEEIAYLDMLDRIITCGDQRSTRNAQTYSLFGEKLVFDMNNGFPLLTTKKMFYRGIFEELIFFLRGNTNTKLLEEKKVMIWHENTTEEFIENNGKKLEEYDMGPMYGFQWRHYGTPYTGSDTLYDGKGIDQLQYVTDALISDPMSRRILMTVYNPAQVDEGVLYPCHGLVVQFYVEASMISLQMYQRSVDTFLGLPFNIASYAALLHIVVNLVNNHVARTHTIDYKPGRVIMILGDTHIYSDKKADHIEVVKKQIKRKSSTYPFPEFRINKKLKKLDDLNHLETSDMEIIDYVSNPTLKAKMVA